MKSIDCLTHRVISCGGSWGARWAGGPAEAWVTLPTISLTETQGSSSHQKTQTYLSKGLKTDPVNEIQKPLYVYPSICPALPWVL